MPPADAAEPVVPELAEGSGVGVGVGVGVGESAAVEGLVAGEGLAAGDGLAPGEEEAAASGVVEGVGGGSGWPLLPLADGEVGGETAAGEGSGCLARTVVPERRPLTASDKSSIRPPSGSLNRKARFLRFFKDKERRP
jgi:hypothetical protein